MTTIRDAIRAGTEALARAGVPDPARDARRMMGYQLGYDGARLFAVERDPLEREAAEDFAALVARRAAREPVSQILGFRDFFGRSFTVTRDVLDPRPETETLVEVALSEPFTRVLDLGTGSGAILVTLLAERPEARGVGTDISLAALEVAGENALRHGVEERLTRAQSDWWAEVGGRYDLIVSNPPYIAREEMAELAPEVRDWEPRIALEGGSDGLDAYRVIAPGAARHLVPGGRLVVEIGPEQGAAVAAILLAAGFESPRIHPDLDGRDRVVSARLPTR